MFKVGARCTIPWPNWDQSQFGHGIVQCTTDLEHLYRIYPIPTHDKHQWLMLNFMVLLMMDAKGVRDMYNILVVVNKHNTARVASFWFIIYYRLVMHGNSNIKFWSVGNSRAVVILVSNCSSGELRYEVQWSKGKVSVKRTTSDWSKK